MHGRLDQQDSYRTRFQATVIEQGRLEHQDQAHTQVVLEQTLFYPTSGGQPHDVGTLRGAFGEAQVVSVQMRNGQVLHLLRGDIPKVGERVQGEIDWSRRYRHMQRHSAQHLLSQACLRVDPAFATVSVSLQSPSLTVDLEGEPNEGALEQAERLVNEIAYQNLSVRTFEVDEGELEHYPLRRPPKVSGRIRLVQMGDWETSACGGTHLRSTAEAAPIKLLKRERVKGGLTRVYACAGLEALEDYRLKHQLSAQLAEAFSAQVSDVPERVQALEAELLAMMRERSALHERLASLLAERLLASAEQTPHGRVVRHLLPETEGELLRPLAETLTRNAEVIALLGATQADKALLLFARSADLQADMRGLLKGALPLVAGRGGGKAEMAQGGGERPEGVAAALEHAAQRLV